MSQSDLSHIADLFLSSAGSPSPPFIVRALLAEHLPEPKDAVRKVAIYLAHQLGSVALLEFKADRTVLKFFAPEQMQLPAPLGKSAQNFELQLPFIMADLAKHTSLLLVESGASSPLLGNCRQVSVLCRPQPQAVISTYTLLKYLAQSRTASLGVTMIDCPSVLQGTRVTERLSQAAEEFLGLTLRTDTVVPISVQVREKTIIPAQPLSQSALGTALTSISSA